MSTNSTGIPTAFLQAEIDYFFKLQRSKVRLLFLLHFPLGPLTIGFASVVRAWWVHSIIAKASRILIRTYSHSGISYSIRTSYASDLLIRPHFLFRSTSTTFSPCPKR